MKPWVTPHVVTFVLATAFASAISFGGRMRNESDTYGAPQGKFKGNDFERNVEDTLTTTGTLNIGSINPVDSDGGTFTATIPSGGVVGASVVVSKVGAEATNVTVVAADGTISGSVSFVMQLAKESCLFRKISATAWILESHYAPSAGEFLGGQTGDYTVSTGSGMQTWAFVDGVLQAVYEPE